MIKRYTVLGIGAAVLASPMDHSAFAQGASLEEIVVTARRRDESLLDIPLSLSAFTAEDIERAGYSNISDLITAVPGVTYESFEAEGRGASPSFRGVATNTGDPTLQNSSSFVDGIYLSGSLFTLLLGDIERVEVIKGPQSALFGRATFSGAINYITKKPGNEFEGNVRATVAQQDKRELLASVSGPIIDERVAFRLSAGIFEQGSPYRNVTNGTRMGEQDIKSFSGALRFTPSERLTADLTVAYTEAEFGEAARAVTALNRGQLAFPAASVIGGNTDQLSNPGLDSETWRTGLTVNYEFASGHELTYIAGAGQEKTRNETDNDYQPAQNLGLFFLCSGPFAGPGCDLFQTVTDRKLSSVFQELALRSNADDQLRWLAGVSYFEEDFDTARIRNFRQPPDFKTSKNLSLFGSVSYDFTEQLTVGLDARLQRDTIQVQVPERGRNQKDDFTSVLPRLIVEYDINGDTLVYFSAARGNKPGTFNPSAPPEFLTVDEEKLWQYELGTKLMTWDGRLSFQAAAFRIDWKNQSFRFNDPDLTVGSYFINAGETDINGFEFSLSVNLAESLVASLAYNWVDAEFQVFESSTALAVLGTADVSGNKTPRTPKNSLFGSLQYNRALPWFGGSTEWFARADVSYRDSMFIDELNLETLGSRTLVNLRVGIDTGAVRTTVFVDNATDTRALPTGFRFGAVALAGLPMPRQAGVTVAFNF